MKTAVKNTQLTLERAPHLFRKVQGLSYDDVLLVPKKGILQSRKDAIITGTVARDLIIDVPIIAAPMTSVVNARLAEEMYKAGGFSFLHRFNTPKEQAEEFQKATINNLTDRGSVCGAAFGLKDAKERIELLYESGCKVFLLDVAHAHSLEVENNLSNLYFPGDVSLIVGSIATAEAASDFIDFGVHGLRVGIGPGAACTTRAVTGFGVAQLSAIMEVYEEILLRGSDVTIMADGSIKSSGDIVKALAAGADTVMVGRLLAGATEAPFPGEYFGMASKRVNNHNAPEGAEGNVEQTGSVEEMMKKLAWGIRSGVSYGGVATVEDLRNHTEFAIIGSGVMYESAIRI